MTVATSDFDALWTELETLLANVSLAGVELADIELLADTLQKYKGKVGIDVLSIPGFADKLDKFRGEIETLIEADNRISVESTVTDTSADWARGHNSSEQETRCRERLEATEVALNAVGEKMETTALELKAEEQANERLRARNRRQAAMIRAVQEAVGLGAMAYVGDEEDR